MAGRNPKHNADYFPHVNNMRSDRKLKAVRGKFNLEGYAVYNMLLETLAEEDLICIEWNKLEAEMIAGDFGIDSSRLHEMVDYFVAIDLLQASQTHLFCRQLDRRLRRIFDKRNTTIDNLRREKGISAPEIKDPGEKSELPSRGSKEKKSKGKEITNLRDSDRATDIDDENFYLTSKKRKLSGKKLIDFERFWKAFDYKRDKAKAADAWLDIPGYSPELIETIVEKAKIEKKNRPEIEKKGRTPQYAQGWLTARRWEDEHDEADPGNPASAFSPEDKQTLKEINHIITNGEDKSDAVIFDKYSNGKNYPDYGAMFQDLIRQRDALFAKYDESQC